MKATTIAIDNFYWQISVSSSNWQQTIPLRETQTEIAAMIESTDDSAHISVDIYRYIVDIRCSFHYRHHSRRHHHHHHQLRCLHQQNVQLLSTSLLPENSSLLPLLASASKFVVRLSLLFTAFLWNWSLLSLPPSASTVVAICERRLDIILVITRGNHNNKFIDNSSS